MATCSESLFECAISRVYADSAVSALSLEQALACKAGCPLFARSLWAGFRQPRRQSFFGQAIGIPHSNRLLARLIHESGLDQSQTVEDEPFFGFLAETISAHHHFRESPTRSNSWPT